MEKHYDPLLKDTLYVERLENGLTDRAGVPPTDASIPSLVHYSDGVDVDVFALLPV